jgi:hypothetical protein
MKFARLNEMRDRGEALGDRIVTARQDPTLVNDLIRQERHDCRAAGFTNDEFTAILVYAMDRMRHILDQLAQAFDLTVAMTGSTFFFTESFQELQLSRAAARESAPKEGTEK